MTTTIASPAERADFPDPHTHSADPPPKWRHGQVTWFDSEKGFGFLSPADGGAPVFVAYHVINLPGYKTLTSGQWALFTSVDTSRGPEATEVISAPPR